MAATDHGGEVAAAQTSIAHVIAQAQGMYPGAAVRVVRGRVIAVDGDVIRLITHRSENPRTRPGR